MSISSAELKERREREKRRAEDIAELTPEDYYNPKPVLDAHGDIHLIWGQRSNGKTYSYLKHALETYKKTGRTFVYVRRWAEDIVVKNMNKLTDPLPVKEIFGDNYNIRFFRGAFELVDETGTEMPQTIGWAVALNQVAHTKSQTFINVKIIILDEFLQLKNERNMRDEFDSWEQTLSTICRTLNDVEIYLLGNSVSKYSPYFSPYGVDPNSFQQGEIKVIELPNDDDLMPTRVIAEWCKYNPKIGKRTSKYVRGSKMAQTGEWELQEVANIPHTDNEHAHETLLCTLFDHRMGINLGIFIRDSVWYTLESQYYRSIQVPHHRQFLVIRQTPKVSSYYHLTTVKGLSYGQWTNATTMFKDILENTDIDILSELQHNRVYCESMFVADYFYHTYDNYVKMGIRDLL